VIRTVTGDVEAIHGRILAHEHLQIDLSAQKGPANKVGEAEIPPWSKIYAPPRSSALPPLRMLAFAKVKAHA